MPRQNRDIVNREVFSVRVDSDLAQQYRHMAIDMRISLSELIERALRQFIAKDVKAPTPRVEAPAMKSATAPVEEKEAPTPSKSASKPKGRHDWPALLEEFKKASEDHKKENDTELSQAAFAKSIGMQPSDLSKGFKKLRESNASNVQEVHQGDDGTKDASEAPTNEDGQE